MKFALHKYLLLAQDIIIIGFVYFIVYYSMQISKNIYFELVGFMILCLLIVVIFKFNHLYKYQLILNPVKHSITLFKSLLLVASVIIIILFTTKQVDVISDRLLFANIFISLFILFLIFRIVVTPLIYKVLVRKNYIIRNLLIIGAGEFGQKIQVTLNSTNRKYFNLVCFLDDDEEKIGTKIGTVPVIGKTSTLSDVILEHNIRHILIAIDNVEDARLNIIVDLCKQTKAHVYIVSKHYKIVSQKMPIEEFSNLAAFKLNPTEKHDRSFYLIKRLLDISISLFLIIALSPIWLIISLAIKFSSPGPILYRNQVVGKNGKAFFWYKFRSMYHNNDSSIHESHLKEIIINGKPGRKLEKDPRITPIGKFIRRYSIDEFPQLICVLRGDMSLVGPRPSSPHEYSLMNEWQKKRFHAIPGITCLWQIYGRNEVKFNEQITFDIYYIEHQSLLMDIEILLKTIPAVFGGINGK